MRGLTASKCSMSAMLVTHRNAKEARIEEEYHSPESYRKSVRSMERITIGLDLGEKSSRYCAIESVFPHAQVQLCIVHLTRASLNYVSWKERKQSPRI